MAKKLLHHHSIYYRFPLYLLFRRCDGEVIMYHHNINSIYISAVDTLSKVQGRSNYIIHSIYSKFLIYLLYRRCYGEVIMYHHSIYSIFLKYLLCRRCEGGAIMHLHSINSIYPRCSSFVVGATVKWSIYRSSI